MKWVALRRKFGLVSLVDEELTVEVVSCQAGPTSPGDRLAFVRLPFPCELHDGCSVALADTIVDGRGDGNQLKLPKAVMVESDVGRHYRVQVLPCP